MTEIEFIGLITGSMVILAEEVIIGSGLKQTLWDVRIFFSMMVSNIVTILLGLFWLWGEEFNFAEGVLGFPYEGEYLFTGFLILNFITTIPIEVIINVALLKSYSNKKDIIKWTLYANLATYLFLTFLFFAAPGAERGL